jgi:DNA-3-methyladenine glycosylase II
MSFSPQQVRAGLKHLRSADPVLRGVIGRVGPFGMKLQKHRFRALVHSIISQQISGGAARSIRARLQRLAGPGGITVDSISRLSPEQLRSAGLSPQKTSYMLDLTTKVRQGEVRLRSVSRMPDEDVIGELIRVKGIGVWTAQMFLMFSLGRLDVFPPDDLGIRSALRNLYGLRELPDKETSHRIAAPWRPYATIASWYCWRSLDLPKDGE